MPAAVAAHAVAAAPTAGAEGSIAVAAAYPGAAQGVAISAPEAQDMSAPEDRVAAAYPGAAVQVVSVAAGEDAASALELPAGAMSEIVVLAPGASGIAASVAEALAIAASAPGA